MPNDSALPGARLHGASDVVLDGPLRLNQFRQAEIKDLHQSVLSHHDVRGLEIAVGYTCRMRPGQGLRHLVDAIRSLTNWHSLARDQGSQGPAGDILHGYEMDPVGRVDIINRYDVGMIQR